MNSKDKKENFNKLKSELKNYDFDEYIRVQLEYYIYKFRDAMLNFSLEFPELSTMEWYCSRLKKYDTFIYCVGLLHKCWCYAHPDYLFNTLSKKLPDEDLLEMVLNKYQPDSKYYKVERLQKEFSKEFSSLLISYYRSFQRLGIIAENYGSYIKSLYEILKSVARRWDIDLNDNFTISYYIKTEKTPQQLEKAFEIISNQFKCCDYTPRNLRTFMSIFETTISEPENRIYWKDKSTSRNKEDCISSLWIFFKALNVDMNIHEKNIICKYFMWGKEAIKPEQLRDRRKNNKDHDKPIKENRLTAIYKAISSI